MPRRRHVTTTPSTKPFAAFDNLIIIIGDAENERYHIISRFVVKHAYYTPKCKEIFSRAIYLQNTPSRAPSHAFAMLHTTISFISFVQRAAAARRHFAVIHENDLSVYSSAYSYFDA